MAKVKSNYLSEISGSLGKNLNFRVRRNGIDMSRQRIPSNPNTPAQQQTRNRYGSLVDKWRNLSQALIDDYNERAKLLGISGWNLYVKEKFALLPPSLLCVNTWTLQQSDASALNEVVDCDEWTINPNPPNQSTQNAKRYIDLENPWEEDFSLEAEFTFQDVGDSIVNQFLRIYNEGTLLAAIGRSDSHSNSRYQEYSFLNGVTLNPDSFAFNNYVNFPVKITRTGSTIKTYYNGVEKQSDTVTDPITRVEIFVSFWEQNDGVNLTNKWKIVNPVPS